MPSLTERSHKASLERLLVQFSYSWQREYYNKRYLLTKKKQLVQEIGVLVLELAPMTICLEK